MKVNVIIGKNQRIPMKNILLGFSLMRIKQLPQKNYLSYGFKSDYYVEEREI